MYRNGSARRTTASPGRQKIESAPPAATNAPATSQKMTVRVDRIHAGYTGSSDDGLTATGRSLTGGWNSWRNTPPNRLTGFQRVKSRRVDIRGVQRLFENVRGCVDALGRQLKRAEMHSDAHG